MLNFDNMLQEIHESIIKDDEINIPIEITSNRTFEVPDGYNTVLGYAGDANSQIVTFKIPLKHENHDLSECQNKRLYWKNLGNEKVGFSNLEILEKATDYFLLQWLVPQEIFASSGQIEISISLYDLAGSTKAFSWNTITATIFSIGNNSQNIIPENLILKIDEKTRNIVAPAGYNKVIANVGDYGITRLYFQVNKDVCGIDVSKDFNGRKILYNQNNEVHIDDLYVLDQYSKDQVILYWDVANELINQNVTFDIAVAFSSPENEVPKRWISNRFSGLTIGTTFTWPELGDGGNLAPEEGEEGQEGTESVLISGDAYDSPDSGNTVTYAGYVTLRSFTPESNNKEIHKNELVVLYDNNGAIVGVGVGEDGKDYDFNNIYRLIGQEKLSNYLTKTYIEENYPTNEHIEENYLTKTYIEENYPTNSHITDNYLTTEQIEQNYFTSQHITNNYLTKTNIEQNYFTSQHITDNYLTKTNIEQKYLTINEAADKATEVESNISTLNKRITNLEYAANGNTYNFEIKNSVDCGVDVVEDSCQYVEVDMIGGMSHINDIFSVENRASFTTEDLNQTTNGLTFSYDNSKRIITITGTSSAQITDILPMEGLELLNKQACIVIEVLIGKIKKKSDNSTTTAFLAFTDTNNNVIENQKITLLPQISKQNFKLTFSEEVALKGFVLYGKDLIFENYQIRINIGDEFYKEISHTPTTSIKTIGENILPSGELPSGEKKGMTKLENWYKHDEQWKAFDLVFPSNGWYAMYVGIKNIEATYLYLYKKNKNCNIFRSGDSCYNSEGSLITGYLVTSAGVLNSTPQNIKKEGTIYLKVEDGVKYQLRLNSASQEKLDNMNKWYIVKCGDLTQSIEDVKDNDKFNSKYYTEYTEETYPIPEKIQQLPDYGVGLSDENKDNYNYIELRDTKWYYTRNVTSKILTGEEDGWAMTVPGSGDFNRFTLLPHPIPKTDYIKSNHYKSDSINSNPTEGIIIHSKCESIEKWKEHLQELNNNNNPLEVVYRIGTPETEEITFNFDGFVNTENKEWILFEKNTSQPTPASITYQIKLNNNMEV